MYQVYRILDDDTLDSLAMRMNIDSEEICRLNGIDFSQFIPGEFIVLPKQNDLYFIYIVKSGDSLYNVSKMYNIDLETLYAINGLDEGDYIYPGQELLLPKDGISIYSTKEGDSIESVSDYMDVSSLDLVRNNSNLYLMPDQIIIYKRD